MFSHWWTQDGPMIKSPLGYPSLYRWCSFHQFHRCPSNNLSQPLYSCIVHLQVRFGNTSKGTFKVKISSVFLESRLWNQPNVFLSDFELYWTSGRLWAFIIYVQLLCLEEKLSPLVLSALDEDSQMARLFACRSLSTILQLIGTSLHPEALNKIYPGKKKQKKQSTHTNERTSFI